MDILDPIIKQHEIVMKGICSGCGVEHNGTLGLRKYKKITESEKTEIKNIKYKCQDCGGNISYKDIQENIWQHNKIQKKNIIKGKQIDG
jgi:hypothetical protein